MLDTRCHPVRLGGSAVADKDLCSCRCSCILKYHAVGIFDDIIQILSLAKAQRRKENINIILSSRPPQAGKQGSMQLSAQIYPS